MTHESNTCPNCGFDLNAEPLLRVHLNSASADWPEHVAGYFSDLEHLKAQGYVTRTASGWYVPTPTFPSQ